MGVGGEARRPHECYNFEHNFGHGKQNLCNNLAVIMILVFLVDQLQHLACKLFQKAVEKERRLSYLWDHMRGGISIPYTLKIGRNSSP